MPKKESTTEELLGLGADTDQAEKDAEFSQRIADFKDTFGTPHGRRVLLAIVENTYQYDSPMTGNSQTFHALGAMDYGRSILNVVALCDPETYQWFHAQRTNDLRKKYEDKIRGQDAF